MLVTFQVLLVVRSPNSSPLAAVVPLRMVAIHHGVLPLAGTSMPTEVHLVLERTESKRTVASTRKCSR